jgi:hypothetical protein
MPRFFCRHKNSAGVGDSEAAPGLATTSLPRENGNGLRVLWSPQDAIAECVKYFEFAASIFNLQIYCDSIIFVHGLTGHREATWTAKGSDLPWPQELLPSEVPKARVLTFGYDARVLDWRSMVAQNRIANHSRNLVHAIANYRDRDNTVCGLCPIIRVCCLILVNRATIQSS